LFFPQALAAAAAAPLPSRHGPIHARVGDGLGEVLAKMSRDHEERSAQGGLTVEHLLRLVGIGVEGHDGIAKIKKESFIA